MRKAVIKYSSKLGSFSWQLLDWDSKLLNRKVAKILFLKSKKSDSLKKLITEIIESFKKNKIEYATYRLNASDFPIIHLLEKEGFKIVDGIIYMEQRLESKYEKNDHIRIGRKKDIEKLKKIAGESFSYNRFYNDPLITKTQANRIFSEWINNCVMGSAADLVFVYEINNNIFGFIAVKKNGNVVLIAVSTKKRGLGIGKFLIKYSLQYFRDIGLKSSTIETQMTNIPALKAYQNCGYKIVDSYLTFRWSNVDYEN